jgi:hypothetical protein
MPSTSQTIAFLCSPASQNPLAALKHRIALAHPLAHAPGFAMIFRRFIEIPQLCAANKSRIVEIEDGIPAAMHGVILTALLTLTKLYHATHRWWLLAVSHTHVSREARRAKRRQAWRDIIIK